ncbi:relaxase [Pseudomonas sp. 91RF]|jgi:integrating conjugative element relaxase (TIGR03760 family)|uniref:MobH family relaxase n=1 Tax=Pseudomonas sp. 91RF TaxID=2292261 RepID=UPI000E6763CE|nr:MobH family relaxase [Pseudomonas sp. 91RF]RIJ06638.1 relaxase [Pseudomonas sp. 91RF]
MFSLFLRKTRPASTSAAPAKPTSSVGLTAPQSAKALLDTPRRQKLLEQIWQRTALSRTQFEKLYLDPISRYAELVQLLPASESHHHAYLGGMLDHGLEVIAYALKLRQSHLLPSSAQPEVQIAQAEAWTAALAYAGLGHDLGKIAVDMHVEYADGKTWRPWHGPLTSPYRFRYRKDRQYRLHGAASGLLIHQLLNRDILDWLCTFPELWTSLIFSLAGQSEHSGELGTLITQADQASVAQALGGDPAKAMSAPKHALQRKLLEGLRYLLGSELKLNQPQASDGWLTQDALWLVSKTVSDKLRAHLLSQGVDGIPEGNIAVFNVLQEHGIALPSSNGKAIWNATVTSETGWSHSFTFLKLSPALIWDATARPAAFSGTVIVDTTTQPPIAPGPPLNTSCSARGNASERATSNHNSFRPLPRADNASPAPDSLDLLMDLFGGPPTLPEDFETVPFEEPELAISSSVEEAIEFSGKHFMDWLTLGVRSHRIIINDRKALVHTVDDTMFLVTPGLFQRYGQEHPQLAWIAKKESLQDWQWIQKRFEELRLHRKQPNGLNIWICEVSGARKTHYLHGFLLNEHGGLMNDLALNNPYLKVVDQIPRKKPRPTIGNTR